MSGRSSIYSSRNRPYISYGFDSGYLYPMSYAGRNYVLMQDFQFATTKGRTVLVVEYRGRWKEDKEYSSLNNVQTDDIKVVCKITHAR